MFFKRERNLLYLYANGKIGVGINGVNEIVSLSGAVTTNAWQYIQITRTNSTSTTVIRVNGTQVASGTTSVWNASSNALGIGGFSTAYNSFFTGYIDELRISKGIVRSNFTPPAYSYPNPPIPAPAISQTSSGISISSSTSGASIYYTTDGSIPTQSSTLYNAPFLPQATTSVNAKAFLAGHPSSSVANFVYVPSYLHGLAALYYAGSLNPLTQIDAAKPYAGETVSQINYPSSSGSFAGSGKATNVSASFRGAVYVPAAGSYTFHLSGDDTARLLIDGTVVIDGVTASADGSATLSLTQGIHSLRCDMAQSDASSKLILEWEGPSITRQVIPSIYLLSQDADADGQADDLNLVSDISTMLLMHFDGNISDSSLYSHQANDSGSTSSTSCMKFGSASRYFNGSSKISLPDSNGDFNFGTDIFTIDFWFYDQVSGVSYPSMLSSTGGWSAGSVCIRHNNTGCAGKVTLHSNSNPSGDPFLTSASTISNNAWHHVALVRDSSTSIKLFVDGALEASATLSSGNTFNFSYGGSMSIGQGPWDGGGGYFKGYIDELRISKGAARWTSSFTPPAYSYPDPPTPAPAISQTSSGISMSCATSGASIYYTVDGSTPTQSSTLYTTPFQPQSTVVIKAKAFLSGYPSSNVTGYTYSPCYLLGLTALYYVNCLTPLTQIDFSKAYSGEVVSQINYPASSCSFAGSGRATNVSASFRGAVYVPAAGSYTFHLSGDDTARLLIDGNVVIDGVTASSDGNATLSLTQGIHSLRCDMAQSDASSRLVLEWEGSGITRQVIPSMYLLSQDADADGQADDLSLVTDIYTKLLMHFDGDVTDSTTFARTVVNYNAEFSSSNKKFGSSSAYLNGSSWMRVLNSADWNLTSSDGTIDFWIYPMALNNAACLIGQTNTSADQQWFAYLYANGKIGVGINGINEITSASNVISTGVWQHIAITRVNSTSTTTIYVNGVSVASGTTPVWNTSSNPLAIGGTPSICSFTGYIDELRFSKGVARWTSNFTPPSMAYKDPSGDSNSNGLPDWFEAKYGVGDPAADPDGDGLTNLQEYQLGLNPLVADTDGDGIGDKAEVDLGYDPKTYTA